MVNWPSYYKYWWMTLYEEAPHHIFIETGLICFIVWLIFIRRTVDPNKASNREKLSKKEVDWLVETWQPEPLVPPPSSTQKMLSESMLVRFPNSLVVCLPVPVPHLLTARFASSLTLLMATI